MAMLSTSVESLDTTRGTSVPMWEKTRSAANSNGERIGDTYLGLLQQLTADQQQTKLVIIILRKPFSSSFSSIIFKALVFPPGFLLPQQARLLHW